MQGQSKVNESSRQGQGKVHNLNSINNLTGFDTIEINLVQNFRGKSHILGKVQPFRTLGVKLVKAENIVKLGSDSRNVSS